MKFSFPSSSLFSLASSLLVFVAHVAARTKGTMRRRSGFALFVVLHGSSIETLFLFARCVCSLAPSSPPSSHPHCKHLFLAPATKGGIRSPPFPPPPPPASFVAAVSPKKRSRRFKERSQGLPPPLPSFSAIKNVSPLSAQQRTAFSQQKPKKIIALPCRKSTWLPRNFLLVPSHPLPSVTFTFSGSNCPLTDP